MEDKWRWVASITPHYPTWRALLPLLAVYPSEAEALPPSQTYIHLTSCSQLPTTHPEGQVLTLHHQKRERPSRTNWLWSELRSVWLTTRSQMVTHSLPLIMLFLTLSSTSLFFLNIFLLYSFSISHTQTAKDRNRRNGGWKERTIRERLFIQPHVIAWVSLRALLLCHCMHLPQPL